MKKSKQVYLATPRGPKVYNLDGNWLTEVDGVAKKPRKARRTKAEMKAAKAGAPPKTGLRTVKQAATNGVQRSL